MCVSELCFSFIMQLFIKFGVDTPKMCMDLYICTKQIHIRHLVSLENKSVLCIKIYRADDNRNFAKHKSLFSLGELYICDTPTLIHRNSIFYSYFIHISICMDSKCLTKIMQQKHSFVYSKMYVMCGF